uniref:Uncharacterized protein n=1 Tax=Caenorhabditis japonica TaxID=281687 RepID=A0A8R1I6I0_CAEJA
MQCLNRSSSNIQILTCDTCEVRPQFPSWILRTKLCHVARSLATVDDARFASSMPILRRPCPRLPLAYVISSDHLFGAQPRGRVDPLRSHSDTIFAHQIFNVIDKLA